MSAAKLNITLTLVQINISRGRPAANLARVRRRLAAAPGGECEIILLPELWGSGYDLEHLAVSAAATPGLLEALAEIAAKRRAWLGGSLVEKEKENYYNTFFLLSPEGKQLAAYRKIHLFSLLEEDRWFSPGNRPVVTEIAGRKVGLLTCYDIRFPELARTLALNGAELLLVCAQWPRPRTRHWSLLLKARALENQLFVAACNRIGPGPEHHYPGASAIYGPWGETLFRAPDRQGAFSAALDFSRLAETRRLIPCFSDRRPECY